MSKEKFDVIIIGSGMSGLTAGSILSNLFGKKILILERHFKIGGFTHIFKRKGEYANYTWDVGLHYVGGMQKGTISRSLMDLVTGGKVQWKRMPEIYDVFVYPGLKFEARAGEQNLKSDLISLFPEEKKAIEKYFIDVKLTSAKFGKFAAGKMLPTALSFVKYLAGLSNTGLGEITLKEYFDNNFKDEKLKSLLASQWGDYGLPPSRSSFAAHAMIVSHYIDGAYYPIGTAKTIGYSASEIIKKNGGNLRVNHFVREIIIENGKAIGVRAEEKLKGGEFVSKEFYADKIISTAGAEITYNQFLPDEFSAGIKDDISSMTCQSGHLNLYIGLKESPEKLGVKGENYWIYNSFDHDKTFENKNAILNGKPGMAYLSFPSLKDETKEGATAEIITWGDYNSFEKWKDQPWKQRDGEYQQIKNNISESLINLVENEFSGFKDILDYTELSTPLSTEFFTGYKNGAIYGIPITPGKLKQKWFGFKTPVKNLYLSGADALMPGIMGALMSGVFTVGTMMNFPFGIMKIFKEAKKFQ